MPSIETDLRSRLETLERGFARLEADLEARPTRHSIVHTASLPIVRTIRPGDTVVRGSGSDAEFFVWDGRRYFVMAGTPKSVTREMLEEDLDTLLDDCLTDAEHTAIGNAAPHHAPATLGAGSDPALGLSGQQFTLADVLTPAEHTAIADSAPHHPAATGGDCITVTGQQVKVTDASVPQTKLLTAPIQTIISSDVLTHNGAETLYITAASNFTCAGSPIIQAGSRQGQPLRVVLIGTATRYITIPSSGNVTLFGSCRLDYYSGDTQYSWLLLEWDAAHSVWKEVKRSFAAGNVNTSIGGEIVGGASCAHSSNLGITVGYLNANSGPNSIVVGNTLNNAGDRAALFGMYGTANAAGDYVFGIGRYYNITRLGEFVHATERYLVDGDCQHAWISRHIAVAHGAGAVTAFSLLMEEDSVYLIDVKGVGCESGCAHRVTHKGTCSYCKDGAANAVEMGESMDTPVVSGAGVDTTGISAAPLVDSIVWSIDRDTNVDFEWHFLIHYVKMET